MLIREVLSSLSRAVGKPTYSFKVHSLREWMGAGMKGEAGQPCRRALPCHGDRDAAESWAGLQHGWRAAGLQGPHGDVETESAGAGQGKWAWRRKSVDAGAPGFLAAIIGK